MSHIGTKFVIAQRFVFDPNSNTLLDQDFSNEIVRLGSNESRILLMLAERPNEVISRNELHEFVWREQGFEVDDSSLTQAISTLRKMLKDSTKSPEFVKTVPKRGYQLICSVERINPLLSDKPSSSEDAPVAEVSNNDVAEFTPDDNEHALLETETHHPKEPRNCAQNTLVYYRYVGIVRLAADKCHSVYQSSRVSVPSIGEHRYHSSANPYQPSAVAGLATVY